MGLTSYNLTKRKMVCMRRAFDVRVGVEGVYVHARKSRLDTGRQVMAQLCFKMVCTEMEVLRGCLIGCGYVSQFHLDAWTRQKLGRLTAVCDLDATKAKSACRYGVCTAYSDAVEMFRKERPDFVEICTRPETHLRLVRLAAEHGVNVLCQKPIAPTLEDLRSMMAACDQAGVRFMVHENFRWRSWYLRMKAEMDAGLLGTPFRLGVEMHDQRCLMPDGLSDQPYFLDMPRLILYEIGPHAIDLARYFFGEPHQVFAVSQRLGRQRGEDVVHMMLWFAGDRTAVLDMSWATAGRNVNSAWGLHDTWIEGTNGTLRLHSTANSIGILSASPLKCGAWPSIPTRWCKGTR